MDKLAAYEMLLEHHPLWNKEAATAIEYGLGAAAASTGLIAAASLAEKAVRKAHRARVLKREAAQAAARAKRLKENVAAGTLASGTLAAGGAAATKRNRK